jgi:hypothetical protein
MQYASGYMCLHGRTVIQNNFIDIHGAFPVQLYPGIIDLSPRKSPYF